MKNRIIILLSVLCLLFFFGFVTLFVRENYTYKILVKMGIKKKTVETNMAVLGWLNCLKKIDYNADIVFFGDSITCDGNFQDFFGDEVQICNLGCSSDTIEMMLERVDMIAAVHPKKVFVLAGINSIGYFDSDIVEKQYLELIHTIKEKVTYSEVYIQSVLPISIERENSYRNNTDIKKFNLYLQQVAIENDCIFIDLYSVYEENGYMNPEYTYDGIHLKPDAYKYWEELINAYIFDLIK